MLAVKSWQALRATGRILSGSAALPDFKVLMIVLFLLLFVMVINVYV